MPPLGDFRFEYEYEIEYENDFLVYIFQYFGRHGPPSSGCYILCNSLKKEGLKALPSEILENIFSSIIQLIAD